MNRLPTKALESNRLSSQLRTRELSHTLLTAAACAALIGCSQQPRQPVAAAPPPPPPMQQPGTVAQPQQAPQQSTATAPAPAPAPQKPAPLVVKDVGFQTPESVLYDAEEDVYLVSNINGSPFEADGDGFISKVSPEGKLLELKWIDGAKKETTLNAPKGMTISGNLLYVADIDTVRIFDRKSGAPRGRVAIPGASFVNDLATAPDGTVYVTDTGLKAGFEPSGTDAVYKIGKRVAAEKVAKNETLGRPNGVAVNESGVWVVTNGTGELFKLNEQGKKEQAQKLPKGSLDGLIIAEDGTMLVSSWENSTVYQGAPGGEFAPVITNVEAPADIGYDTKRKRVLVPLFKQNAIEIHSLGAGGQALAATPAAKQPASKQTAQPPAGTAPQQAAAPTKSATQPEPSKKAAQPAQKKAAPGNNTQTAATEEKPVPPPRQSPPPQK